MDITVSGDTKLVTGKIWIISMQIGVTEFTFNNKPTNNWYAQRLYAKGLGHKRLYQN